VGRNEDKLNNNMERSGYVYIVEMTDEEKFEIYMKFSKEEIIKMHIELERVMKNIGSINRVLGPTIYPVNSGTAQIPIEYYLGTSTEQKIF